MTGTHPHATAASSRAGDPPALSDGQPRAPFDEPLDVLVVAAHRDFEITAQCLRNLAAYFPDRAQVYLATDRAAPGRALVEAAGLSEAGVLPDNYLLAARERRLPGWYRQQLVKLRAGAVLRGERFCVMSGDALLARPLPASDLVSPSGRPYLYVNRYRYPSRHLAYERRRVRAVAEMLGATPTVSLELGDFISDLFCFERSVLADAIARLQRRLGRAWTRVLDGRSAQPFDQERFGEYTLYAVAALECGLSPPPVRVRRESHVLQLHSRRSLSRARFDAAIVHIVDKELPLAQVVHRAALFGQDLCPSRVAPDTSAPPAPRR